MTGCLIGITFTSTVIKTLAITIIISCGLQSVEDCVDQAVIGLRTYITNSKNEDDDSAGELQ